MNITLFNRPYWIRRFGEQKIIAGYLTSGYEDFSASLHIHPGTSQQQPLPEGERRIRRLDGHGNIELIPADHEAGVKGDLLLYDGRWYECVSCVRWDHTVLNHWNYSFVQVPEDAAGTADLDNKPE